MTQDFEHAIRSTLHDFVAAAPDPDGPPVLLVTVDNQMPPRRPYLAVAASLVMLAGVGGLVVIATNDPTPTSPAAAPSATDESSATTPLATETSAAVVSATTTPACTNTGGQASVPNVAGMPKAQAVAALAQAGLEPNARQEHPPPGVSSTDADYAVVRQNTAPGTTTSCGTKVEIVVAYRPGALYVVKEGDSYQSIAASQGLTLDQLLGFSGLTVAELAASGQSTTAPLDLGQALPLSSQPATDAAWRAAVEQEAASLHLDLGITEQSVGSSAEFSTKIIGTLTADGKVLDGNLAFVLTQLPANLDTSSTDWQQQAAGVNAPGVQLSADTTMFVETMVGKGRRVAIVTPKHVVYIVAETIDDNLLTSDAITAAAQGLNKLADSVLATP